MKKNIILIITIFVITSCKEATDLYLGIPLQPRFDENSYVPGLNIFGILRNDSTEIYNNSFIEIQKVMPAVGGPDSLTVDTVLVTIKKVSNSTSTESYNFSLTDFDSTFSQSNYRPEGIFTPEPGEIYSIECDYPELPVLRATTIIPQKAEIVINSIQATSSSLSFEIKEDSTFFMLDVYFYSGPNLAAMIRQAAESGKNTYFETPINEKNIDSVIVFSYDFNIAKYYLTTNTSLNFNKYRNSYSTVENGYGVFGSLNKNIIKISVK